jgi:hypothetical protein
MHLLTFTYAPTLPFFHFLAEESASYIGLRSTAFKPHQRYDVDTFDIFSAIYRGPARKGEYIHPGNLDDRVDPLSNPLLSPVCNTNRAAVGKFAFT